MNSYKEEIKILALEVHKELIAYIKVHDYIRKEGASFISTIKNMLGFGVPMSKLLEDSEKLIPVWNKLSDNVEAFRNKVNDTIKEDEMLYLNILCKYVKAVKETVFALVKRQKILNEQSKRVISKPNLLGSYMQSQNEYERLIKQYTAIGQELMDNSIIIFK